MSIVLDWSQFKAYATRVGPGGERPPRPDECVFCAFARVWFNGWRRVLVTVLVDGRPLRAGDWVHLQLVRCARRECHRSWTLQPAWAYPHRSFEPDVAEAAALAYLAEPRSSYAAVARWAGCAWVTVWLWCSWIASLAIPGALLARIAHFHRSGAIAEQLPWSVAAAARARSSRRQRLLLRAYQVLTALAMLHRAQPEPPSDPSPLRWFLAAELAVFRRKALLRRPGFSPAFSISRRARPP